MHGWKIYQILLHANWPGIRTSQNGMGQNNSGNCHTMLFYGMGQNFIHVKQLEQWLIMNLGPIVYVTIVI